MKEEADAGPGQEEKREVAGRKSVSVGRPVQAGGCVGRVPIGMFSP